MSGPTEDFWQGAGIALVIFSLCLGVGSCSLLANVGATLHENKNGGDATSTSDTSRPTPTYSDAPASVTPGPAARPQDEAGER